MFGIRKSPRARPLFTAPRPFNVLRASMPVWLAVILASCGYRVAGRGDALPPDVKTIAVPPFTNESRQYKIEQTLAKAVTRELIERTHFRVTTNPSDADAVLKGTVKNVQATAATFDVATGRANSLQIVVNAAVELVDQRTAKVLFSNPNYTFREEYAISSSNAQLFEQDQPALRRLSRDLARTLVTDILENY